MLVEQIPVHNNLRNYMYLVACPDTLEAAAVDPLEHQLLLARAAELGWRVRSVINTHEHYDHIGGNEPVIAQTGAELFAHHQAVDKIPNVDHALKAGDAIQIGSSVSLFALDTPGHTFCHTCLYYRGKQAFETTDQTPALFSGDTLFNAGVGNCHNGGDPQVLYQTFRDQLFELPDYTRIYPGHDYIENNLRFSLDREPNNQAAQSLLAAIEQWQGDQHFISNIAMEKRVNAFFRLSNQEIIGQLQNKFPSLGDAPTEEEVFLRLRELRNHW